MITQFIFLIILAKSKIDNLNADMKALEATDVALSTSFEDLKNELSRTSAELSTVKTSLANSRAEQDETKASLESTRAELEDTKRRLDTSESRLSSATADLAVIKACFDDPTNKTVCRGQK